MTIFQGRLIASEKSFLITAPGHYSKGGLMPKMKDLGINVIPETMRPAECLPWTVGPVCHPGGVTFDPCGPASCGCSHITNPCLGCTHIVSVLCVAHTTITFCVTG